MMKEFVELNLLVHRLVDKVVEEGMACHSQAVELPDLENRKMCSEVYQLRDQRRSCPG
jgi:hypothetical protein